MSRRTLSKADDKWVEGVGWVQKRSLWWDGARLRKAARGKAHGVKHRGPDKDLHIGKSVKTSLRKNGSRNSLIRKI